MRYKVEKYIAHVEPDGEEPKDLFLGWIVFDTQNEESMDERPLEEKEARRQAAILEWANHLDRWMTTLVEDEDVVEDIGEILGVSKIERQHEDQDGTELEKSYDAMVVKVIELLPSGMRALADLYEKEWKRVHAG